MLCSTCGTQNRAGSRFCDNCGTPLEAACPTCGAPNRADARFYAGCGRALTGPSGTIAGPSGTIAAPTAAIAAPSGTIAAPSAALAGPSGTIEGSPPRPVAPRDAERRLVSVLFVDLVGFTGFAEDRDAETVRDLLSRYFDLASAIVERHGGTVEKFIGDAVMAVWGAPVAHEDDAERAVRAALELVGAVPTVRAGLLARAAVVSGEAAVTLGAHNQGMVAGDLVNTAARLQGLAAAGTVLVGEATMRAAQGAVSFEAVGDRTLKGKSMPVPAWQAVRVVAARGGQGRADTLEAPFVGRDEDLRQLKEVLHGVGRDRRARLVSITGVAGIGKSRLVWELEKYVDGIAEAIYWHRGRSPSYGEGITFWALGEMVRRRAQLTEDADAAASRERVAATVAEYVTDPDDRARIESSLLALLGVDDGVAGPHESLFPAWRQLFERIAERGTVVLVFEDIQWADEGLLDFIDHLLDWSRGLPILVITLARPELFDRRPDWGSHRRSLTALALEPLADPEMRRLLDGLVPGLPERATEAIVGRAEGIPLYAVETVRSLLADGRLERHGDAYRPLGDLSAIAMPNTLRALIASRLDALAPPDRELLQDAAVLGQVFRIDDLVEIGRLGRVQLESHLRDLVRRELLDVERDPASPERGHHKFVQSLIREVAYGMLARRDRRARHLAVARRLEAAGDEESAGALASHYLAALEASEPGAEADALARQARLALGGAADRAVSLGAHAQALAFLEQALQIASGPADRAQLLDRAATSAAAVSLDASGYAEDAVVAYRELGDEAAAIGASARLARYLIDAGELNRAAEALETLVPQAEASGDEPVLAEVLVNLARSHMRAGRSEAAVAAADRALVIAEHLGLEPILADAFNNKAAALDQLGRIREALALYEAAVAIAVAGPDRNLELRCRNNLASTRSKTSLARAVVLLDEALELARTLGDRAMYGWILGVLGFDRFSMGQGWDAFLAEAHATLETSLGLADRLRLHGIVAQFEIARGEGMDAHLAELTAMVGDSTEPERLLILRTSRAAVALMRGDLQDAFAEAWTAFEGRTQDPLNPLLIALRAAIWARDPGKLRQVVAAFQGLPQDGGFFRAFPLHAQASLAAVEGRVADALDGFRGARDILGSEMDFELACFAVDAAVVLPEEPEVRAWAAASRPLLEELRARPYIERLDAAFADAPAAPTARGLAEVPPPAR